MTWSGGRFRFELPDRLAKERAGMKLGLYGLPGAGRHTVYEALGAGLKAEEEAAKPRKGGRLAVVLVPDERLGPLSEMFHPKKTTPARITYIIPDDTAGAAQSLAELAAVDGLIFVVGNFGEGGDRARKDLDSLEDELIIRDLSVAEGVLERAEKGRRKGQDYTEEEIAKLKETVDLLNEGLPIRTRPDLAQEESFKSYSFLSAKPRLIVANNAEGDPEPPDLGREGEKVLVLQALIEKELAQMEPEEAEVFREEYGLTEPGLDRVVRASYEMMNLISFFTVGEDEVRAWSLKKDAGAAQAAGVIHSDLEKGFIRAEVVQVPDLLAAGSLAEAKKKALLRLEGKDYIVKDGDVLNIRFNV